jgi:hypothetical protein
VRPDRPTTLPGANPLVRGSDRLEALARAVFVCGLLAAALIGLTAGTAAHTQAREQAASDAADRHRVPATLVADAPAPAGEVWADRATAEGVAGWTDRTGVEHRATVAVRAGTATGDPVSVWVDADGNRTPPPMTAADVTGRAVGQGLGIAAGLGLLACGAHLQVRTLLDRSRSRRWAADWAAVEPLWSRSQS